MTTPSKKTAMIINSNDNHSNPSQDFPKIAFFDIWSKMVEFAQNSSQERIIMMATYYQPNLVSKNTKTNVYLI